MERAIPSRFHRRFAPFYPIRHLDPKVCKDGWVEDNRGNKVGRVVKGDPEKMIGHWVHVTGVISATQPSQRPLGGIMVSGRAERWTDYMAKYYNYYHEKSLSSQG